MRILNLDATRVAQGFRALGHDVLCAGFAEDADIPVTHPRHALSVYAEAVGRGFVPDWVFWCDAGNLPYFPGVEELPCPTALYSIDTYCNVWHFGFAHAFDVVFVAQKGHLPLFPQDTVPAYWLPLFADRVPEEPAWTEREIPIAIVGNLRNVNNPDREPFLRSFRRRQPLLVHAGSYVDVFSRSRIALNQTACSEVNYRCFEAMACGAALLMEYSLHGLDALFTPGENILPLYARNDWKRAARIAADALRTPETLRDIARAGRELVVRNHLVFHRAMTVVATMRHLVAEDAASRRLEQLDYRREFLAATYAMLGLDLAGTGRLEPCYANHYFSLAGAVAGAASQ